MNSDSIFWSSAASVRLVLLNLRSSFSYDGAGQLVCRCRSAVAAVFCAAHTARAIQFYRNSTLSSALYCLFFAIWSTGVFERACLLGYHDRRRTSMLVRNKSASAPLQCKRPARDSPIGRCSLPLAPMLFQQACLSRHHSGHSRHAQQSADWWERGAAPAAALCQLQTVL